MVDKPKNRPKRPFFSSGPCAKPPEWSLDKLDHALLGRSHRSSEGKFKLKSLIERTRAILSIPHDYLIAIVPASDTGAFEMAMWSLLGARSVEAIAFEVFGNDWVNDIKNQLKLENVRYHMADYGQIPDLSQIDQAADIVFTWNGTTGGTRVPNGEWISDNREGLTLCDATSAVFAYDMPWEKLDATSWSWQKILGGEAAHGMLVLSPRAVKRLEGYEPIWPIPKIFRLTKNRKLIKGIFEGETINTPSMLCVEDLLYAYDWVDSIGGLPALIERSKRSFAHVENFVKQNPQFAFLCQEPDNRSRTSICLSFSDLCPLAGEARENLPKEIAQFLTKEGIAYDINGHRAAPPHLRIWGGATVDPEDIAALMPWIGYAYGQIIHKG